MKFLIQDTTKEERKELVRRAFMISVSGAKEPSEEALKLANEYIEGKKELAEIQKQIIEKYKKEENTL